MKSCGAWMHLPVILLFGKLKQGVPKSEASLGFMERPCLKTTKQNKTSHITKLKQKRINKSSCGEVASQTKQHKTNEGP